MIIGTFVPDVEPDVRPPAPARLLNVVAVSSAASIPTPKPRAEEAPVKEPFDIDLGSHE